VYNAWSKEYGDLIYLNAMGQGMLVLNSMAPIDDLFVGRASEYSHRSFSIVIKLIKFEWAFSLMDYGADWRDHRRLFHQQLNATQMPRYHPMIEDEVAEFLARLLARPKEHRDLIRYGLGSMILRMAYGSEDRAYNERLSTNGGRLVDGLMYYSTPGRLLVGLFPVLRHVPTWLPGAGWKRALDDLADLSDEVIAEPFGDAKERLRLGLQKDGNNLAAQYIDRLPDEDHPEYKAKEKVALQVAAVAYVAGADTTVSSALALVLALAMHPEYQRKAQAQLDDVLGAATRLPTFADVGELPYIQALVLEVGRWFTVVPFSLPRVLQRDDEYRGYRVPAGTLVLPNTWAIMHDPATFGADALEFNPERYLKDGKINPAVLSPEAASFGYSRRICPGRHFSDESLAMLIASMLTVFDIHLARDERGEPRPLSLEIETTLLCTPKPYDVDIVPRSPAHAELIASLGK